MNNEHDDATFSALRTAPLLDSLTRLRELVSKEDNAAAFASGEGQACHESFLELRRLERSLDQYQSRKGQQLTYIGLLGHFSAGKSSTINALLEDGNKTGDNGQRKTGQHPTDRAVTLITHSDNAQSLIGMHRRGEVEVGAALQDIPLLRETVLVDTPGSGDPLIVEEMVRDFLPICDHLLYVFSAAVPLDTTDLPILQKAHGELPFIPLRFIITRADEFKIDHDAPLTEENFDQQGADHFIGEFISRLEAAVSGLEVRREDFVMIDNRSQFRLSALRKMVTEHQLNAGSAKSLHSHKLRYFAISAGRIHAQFTGHLKGTHQAQQALLSAAKDNHARYQKAVAMSHNRLTENWQLQAQQLKNLRNTHREALGSLAFTAMLPGEMERLPETSTAIATATDLSRMAATETAEMLAEKLQEQWKQAFENGRNELTEAIKNADDPETVSLTIPAPNHSEEVAGLFALPEEFTASLEILPDAMATELTELQSSTQATATGLMQWLTGDRLSKKATELLDSSQQQLAGMLDSFLESVDVYKAAVLSLNARELAQRAGVVQAIEELEQVEIPEQKRDGWLRTVVQRIFPDRQKLEQRVRTESDGLDDALRQVCVAPPKETDPSEARALNGSDSTVADTKMLADLLKHAAEEFQNKANATFQKVIEHKDEALASHKTTLLETVARLRNDEKRVRRTFAASGMIVGIIVFVLASLVLPLFQPFTIFSTGIGLVLIAAGMMGGVQLAEKFDRSGAAIDDCCQAFRQHARTAMLESLTELECPDSRTVAEQITGAADILHKNWQAELSEVTRNASAHHQMAYDQLRTARNQIESVRGKALESGQRFYSDCEAYYDDIDGNLAQLANISAEIKEDAILPSFTLFERRASELATLLEKIEATHFETKTSATTIPASPVSV